LCGLDVPKLPKRWHMVLDSLEELRIQEIRSCLSATSSVLGIKQKFSHTENPVFYASSPVTTGQRMWRVFRRNGVQTLAQLKEIDSNIVRSQIVEPNVREGTAFAKRLRVIVGSTVISPADFTANGWTQGHYMAYWERMLIECVHVVCLKRGWQFSNGCAEEFVISLLNDIVLREEDGITPLDPQVGTTLLLDAIRRIDRWKFDTTKLVGLYTRATLHLSGRRSS
jgi:hypothetical protein